MKRKLYQHIAARVAAMENCRATKNGEWLSRHRSAIEWLAKNHLPSGSGINSGTQVDTTASKPDRLVLQTSFHHMNEGGYYDGWTDHTVIVTPSLVSGTNLRITGRDRNDIKEYLAQVFDAALDQEVDDVALQEAV